MADLPIGRGALSPRPDPIGALASRPDPIEELLGRLKWSDLPESQNIEDRRGQDFWTDFYRQWWQQMPPPMMPDTSNPIAAQLGYHQMRLR